MNRRRSSTTSSDDVAKLLNKFGTHTIAPSEIMDSIHDYFLDRDISSEDDSSSSDTDSNTDSDAENADLSYYDIIDTSSSALNEEPMIMNRASSTVLNEEPMIMNQASSSALNEEPMIMNRASSTVLNEEPMIMNRASSSALNEEPVTENPPDFDLVIIDNIVKTIKPITSLFSQLFEEEDEKKIKDFLVSGCGCQKGNNKKSCLSRFPETEIRQYRLECFELDVMIEHENKLNDLIVAQLSALLHRMNI